MISVNIAICFGITFHENLHITWIMKILRINQRLTKGILIPQPKRPSTHNLIERDHLHESIPSLNFHEMIQNLRFEIECSREICSESCVHWVGEEIGMHIREAWFSHWASHGESCFWPGTSYWTCSVNEPFWDCFRISVSIPKKGCIGCW